MNYIFLEVRLTLMVKDYRWWFMLEHRSPKLGQIAKVIRGNEMDRYVVIVGIIDSKFCMVADGQNRKIDHPKKKNILHLQLQDSISQIVLDSIQETGRVTNNKLKCVLIPFNDK
jgi:large subunit ribosomal protein L14e